ncbi:MAG: carbohydrate-binding family 9-like protein [Thermoanaerobaculia bacterium]
MEPRASVAVPHREFDSTEPWNIPAGCPPVVLRRATDGATPRLATLLHLYRDAMHLYLLFSGVDASIRATKLERDAPLWEEDVLEAFLAPADPARYFEIEVSPIGTLFDTAIESPDGERATMRADPRWDSRGAWAALRRVRRGADSLWRFETLLVVPFADLGVPPPGAESRWRANFFRIDRDDDLGDEFSAWQPTERNPPDFHVPAAFGELVF